MTHTKHDKAPTPKERAWGLGGPARFDLPKKRRGDIIGFGLADQHGEYCDEAVLKAWLAAIKDIQPDFIAIVGDLWNFDIISRWQEKILKRMSPLDIHKAIQSEIWDGNRIGEKIRNAAGAKCKIIVVEGNHCDRLRKYLTDDLQEGWDTAREWLEVDAWADGYYTRAGVFIRDDFLIRHGDKTGKNPAVMEYNEHECSGWTGHLHIANTYYHKPKKHSRIEHQHTILPAMCRTDYNYGPGNAGLARWHRGGVVGRFDSKDHYDHHTDVCRYQNGRLRVWGESYR